MEKSIKVFAPASVSNIGCGFDTLGFAIKKPGDRVIVRLSSIRGIRISKITGDGGQLPYEPELNTASVAAASFIRMYGVPFGVDIEIRKKMPLGSGLGSSAASAVGAVFALNEILDRPFKKSELLNFALEGERAAVKSVHADNIAPSLMGGFVLVRSYDPLEIVNVPFPKNLYCTVIHPDIIINTSSARKLIKRTISLRIAREHFGNIGSLITGLITEDFDLISRSIDDKIAEPVRANLIPGYYDIKNAALEAGALACNISGSGPSMFAFCRSRNESEKIGEAMQKEAANHNLKSKIYISKINKYGPRVIN